MTPFSTKADIVFTNAKDVSDKVYTLKEYSYARCDSYGDPSIVLPEILNAYRMAGNNWQSMKPKYATAYLIAGSMKFTDVGLTEMRFYPAHYLDNEWFSFSADEYFYHYLVSISVLPSRVLEMPDGERVYVKWEVEVGLYSKNKELILVYAGDIKDAFYDIGYIETLLRGEIEKLSAVSK